jgi:type VI secretion system protein VasI
MNPETLRQKGGRANNRLTDRSEGIGVPEGTPLRPTIEKPRFLGAVRAPSDSQAVKPGTPFFDVQVDSSRMGRNFQRKFVRRNNVAMTRFVFFAGLVCLFASPVVAQECGVIDNDLDRLACYDKASGRTPTTEAVTTEVGKWDVSIEKSEFKDTTDVYLQLASNEPIQCGMLGSPAVATLVLRCKENATAIYISTACHFASGFDGYGKVEHRVDDKQSGETEFTASTDNSALGLWQGWRVTSFIKMLLGGNTLLVRFTPYNESPKTAKFNIAGIGEAIVPLREACQW